MYDLDGDELISREELLCVLHMMVGANIRWVTWVLSGDVMVMVM